MAKRKHKAAKHHKEHKAAPVHHKPSKKDYRFVWWIVAIVAIIVIILAIRGAREAPEEPAAPAPEPVVTEPEPESAPELPSSETVVAEGKEVTEAKKAEGEEKGLAVDVKTAEGFGLTCAEMEDGSKRITLNVQNVGDMDWYFVKTDTANKNVGIMNRGVADPTPGCEPAMIAPGEIAVCSTIDAALISGENRVTLSAPNRVNLAGFVECP